MQKQATSYPKEVTLNNCDKEPIHLINAIQSHGYMLVCELATKKILGCSQSINTFIDVNKSLNKTLEVAFPALPLAYLYKSIEEKSSGFIETTLNDAPYIIIYHINVDNHLILEIEAEGETVDAFKEQAQLSTIFSELGAVNDDQAMCDATAKLVKEFLGYDRVMIYKFDKDWNGQVVSESKEAHLEPWLGLHYPATDIPKQARALFLRQGVRIVANVNSTTNPIESKQEHPFDLSLSELRAVSPIHIQYLKNMGVGATLAASITFKGHLWGLIVGHHYSPKFINYYKRLSCKFLTQVFSTQLGLRTSNASLQKISKSNLIRSKLIEQMSAHWEIQKGLNDGKYSILDLTEATGAVSYLEGTLTRFGSTPEQKDVLPLLQWIKDNETTNTFYTNTMSSLFAPAKAYTEIASGVMCLFTSTTKNNALLWFKAEKRSAVDWAGQPTKDIAANATEILTPRTSFSKWTEEQHGVSKPWEDYEIATATAMRDHIAEVILKKYEEIQELNQKLTMSYNELEAFSYSVSHDLRAPLRGIDGFAQIIKEDYYDSLDDFGKSAIETIINSTSKMNTLIDDILSFSGLGKKSTNRSTFPMLEVAKECLNYLQAETIYKETTIELTEGLGSVTADKSMIFQLMVNLISNALKYSSKTAQPKITIGRTKNIYFVKDNGIGFDMTHKDKIFGVFNRLVNDEYEGSGIGLALANRVIEKHNGTIWVEGALGEGTTFYFKLDD